MCIRDSQERRHSNTAGNPDLLGARILPCHVEATIRPFNLDGMTDLQSLAQGAGVITQRLDLETDAPITPIRTGDRERMCPLFLIEGNERKLTGAMATPVVVKLASDGKHIRGRLLDGRHGPAGAACSPDATDQRVQGTINSGSAKQRDENADCLLYTSRCV